MCGIFVHIFFLTPKSRREIAEILINGLKAQEYRGYDSAGKYKSFIFIRFLPLYVVIKKKVQETQRQFTLFRDFQHISLLGMIYSNFFQQNIYSKDIHIVCIFKDFINIES